MNKFKTIENETILYDYSDFPSLSVWEIDKILGRILDSQQELFPTDLFKLTMAELANEKLKAIFGNYIINKDKIKIDSSRNIGFSCGKIEFVFYFHFEGKKYKAKVLQKENETLKKLVLYDKFLGIFNYITKVIYY